MGILRYHALGMVNLLMVTTMMKLGMILWMVYQNTLSMEECQNNPSSFILVETHTQNMAVDITLWQMIQDTRAQKTEPKKDYISALWAEYKRGSLLWWSKEALSTDCYQVRSQTRS